MRQLGAGSELQEVSQECFTGHCVVIAGSLSSSDSDQKLGVNNCLLHLTSGFVYSLTTVHFLAACNVRLLHRANARIISRPLLMKVGNWRASDAANICLGCPIGQESGRGNWKASYTIAALRLQRSCCTCNCLTCEKEKAKLACKL